MTYLFKNVNRFSLINNFYEEVKIMGFTIFYVLQVIFLIMSLQAGHKPAYDIWVSAIGLFIITIIVHLIYLKTKSKKQKSDNTENTNQENSDQNKPE